MDAKQLATTLALAERLCPSMNGASADRFADALETLGPSGVEALALLDDEDRLWIENALIELPEAAFDRWYRTVDELAQEGVAVVTSADDAYPTNLRMVHNRPPVLFVRGELRTGDSRAVAVVGTRDASEEGSALRPRSSNISWSARSRCCLVLPSESTPQLTLRRSTLAGAPSPCSVRASGASIRNRTADSQGPSRREVPVSPSSCPIRRADDGPFRYGTL